MKKKLKSGDFGLLVVDCIVINIALIPFILYHFNTYHLNSEGRIGLAIISCVVFGLSISGIIVCFNKNKSLANFRAGGFFAFSASLVLAIGNGTIYSLCKQPLNEKVVTFLLAIPACAIALAFFIYSFVLKTGNNKKDTIEVKENLDRYQNPAARAPKETNFIAKDSEVERSSKEDSNDQPKDEKPVKIDKDNILEVCGQIRVKDDENSYENVCAILRSTAFIKLLELKSEYKNQLKEFENVKNIGEFLYVFKKFQRQEADFEYNIKDIKFSEIVDEYWDLDVEYGYQLLTDICRYFKTVKGISIFNSNYTDTIYKLDLNKVKITAYFVRYKFETDMVLLEVSGLPDDFKIEDKKRTTFDYYGSKYIFGSFSLDDYKDDDLD